MAHTAMLFCCSQTTVPALALRAYDLSCWYAFLPAVALCPLRRLSPSGCAVRPLPLTCFDFGHLNRLYTGDCLYYNRRNDIQEDQGGTMKMAVCVS
uniref:Uncharacterized protein n=1 Tax=Aegilops tauschii TaxID=37682 RepID=M8C7P2_AEGTA